MPVFVCVRVGVSQGADAGGGRVIGSKENKKEHDKRGRVSFV